MSIPAFINANDSWLVSGPQEMRRPGPSPDEERILILASPEQDAKWNASSTDGLFFERCQGLDDLCRKIDEGAGAALIDGGLLSSAALERIARHLVRAPAWSDLPIVLLVGKGTSQGLREPMDARLAALGNVNPLEKPFHSETLVATLRSALRARRRQYQLRGLLRKQEKAVERLDLLAEIANHLLMSEKPDQIVSSVFRKIGRHLGLEVYLHYLFDETTSCLHLSSHCGLPVEEAVRRRWLDLHESFCGPVAEQGKRVVAENIQSSNDPTTAHVKELGLRAYACFPLRANSQLIGTLSFGVRDRDRFEHEELALMETICNQVAVALVRQRSEEALHELNQDLEKRVQDRTAQLQESNEHMEAFTYSISHDLRAPLRAIRGFAQALTEDYSAALDQTGREYLARMSAGAERLDSLIQDLLQYSRLGRSTLTFSTVHLETSVRHALRELDREIQASGAAVEIEIPLPDILGHEPTLEQVLTNLLSNALKFVDPAVKPRIRIWGTQNEQTARLWIEDNGIGVAPVHHQRIFGVFERLHSTDVYPGTGIGLAIVAKGVARMGGRAGVESEAGQGSRFWIELPRPTAEPA
jgi:signal transduction histidine kinase